MSELGKKELAIMPHFEAFVNPLRVWHSRDMPESPRNAQRAPNSPWLHELKRQRPEERITKNETTDIAIIGGGIAGIMTAYFTLKLTKKRVMLIEASRVAHGATGHNAGQIVSYFERPLWDIAEEFGLPMAADAQRSIESTWTLLDEMYAEAKLKTPLERCTGYVGIANIETLHDFLKNNVLRREANLPFEQIHAADSYPGLNTLAAAYEGTYSTLPHQAILDLLETKDEKYIAAGTTPKGCVNSAALCEELAVYLQTTYPDRFALFEHSPVNEVRLQAEGAHLTVQGFMIKTDHVVLCTNGFEHVTLINEAGAEIDTKFHANINGVVGYMTGYLEGLDRPPTAVSYLPSTHEPNEDYIYLTRRPYEGERSERHNLVCIGGPVEELPDRTTYHPGTAFPDRAIAQVDTFLKTVYRHSPADPNYRFMWHGLMGYTPNRIRLIGAEPCNPHLLYNLGCNGVGILPSIYGGKRIGELLSGKNLPPSIFDPRDQRCELPKR